MNPVLIDYETFYSKKLKYTLTTDIAEHYCKSHLFDPYLISASDGETCWVGPIRDFNFSALKGRTVLAHNAYFEKTVTAECETRGWIDKGTLAGISEFHCTANLTSFLCNRRALDEAVEHLFGQKLSKMDRKEADGKRWPKDFSPEQQKSMLEYGRRDCWWPWKIWDKFSSQWPTSERRISNLTIEQGRRGVQINVALLDDYLMQSHEMLKNTEQLIPWVVGADDEEWEEMGDSAEKPTSTKCIAEQCKRSGIPCPPVKGDDEEAFDEWKNTYGPNHKWIFALEAWRSINKLYKTFKVVKERLRPDGTLPFALKYFGAHTGRWSGDARINMQNMRKLPVVCNEHGLMEMNERRVYAAVDCHSATGKWPEWVKYVIDFRHLIIPRPGKKMIVSDLSQIEPRVLAWLCGNTTMLDMLRSGMSVYEAHARVSMNWTGGKLEDENPAMYKLAKARVLALGYQAGWEKFITMAFDLSRLDITKDDPEWLDVPDPVTGEMKKISGYGFNAKKVVAEFRAQNPRLVNFWDNLDQSFKRSIGSDFVMALPSGRKMNYRGVRCECRIEPDPETKKPRRKSVFTADTNGRRVIFYGGKLTENVTQAASRDVFAEHLLRIEDDYGADANLFSVHDEAVLEVDENVTARDVEATMSYCPEWLQGCPISAKAKEVPHYLK